MVCLPAGSQSGTHIHTQIYAWLVLWRTRVPFNSSLQPICISDAVLNGPAVLPKKSRFARLWFCQWTCRPTRTIKHSDERRSAGPNEAAEGCMASWNSVRSWIRRGRYERRKDMGAPDGNVFEMCVPFRSCVVGCLIYGAIKLETLYREHGSGIGSSRLPFHLVWWRIVRCIKLRKLYVTLRCLNLLVF